jgi:cobaltochelatase CobN
MNSTRLLFISPGNNLCHLGPAIPRIAAEQKVTVEVRNLLAYQLAEGIVQSEELDRLVNWASVVLFDIRDGRELAARLRYWREQAAEKTFIPLMGGSMEVMGLCRMGSFNFDRALKRKPSGRPINFRRIEQLTALIDKLGGILPVGALGHARNWVRVVRYWTAGGAANTENLLRLVLREYCGGRGPRPQPPVERPVHRLESALDGRIYATAKAYRDAHPADAGLPTVALLYYGGLHYEAAVVGAAALERALAGRANVLPIATDGVRSLEAVQRLIGAPDGPRVDAIVNLMWFRLNGGPLGGATEETDRLLRQLDVPYIVPITLYGRERDTWDKSAQGLSPVETYAAVVLPELDGATGPIPVLALERDMVGDLQVTEAVAIDDRVARVCDRLLRWVELRRVPRGERRVALVTYDYPPGPGSAGSASYLDVSRTLAALLTRLEAEGYDVGKGSTDPLGELLSRQIHNANGQGEWAGERLSLHDYQRAWQEMPPCCQREVEEAFGAPPGAILADDEGLRIPGRWFGKVFVGLQPARTAHCDDPRPTHDRAMPPHHQYLAFYTYLRQRGVQVTVHIGTHGTVEFLPGKELGLSARCFPDFMQADIPQLYIYTLANPSEGTLARRRWHASLVTHHHPDLVPAGLHGKYQELLDQLERGRDPAVAPDQRTAIIAETLAQARGLGLTHDDSDCLEHELRDLQHAAIPQGLHVFGQVKDGRSLRRYLVQLARRPVAGVRLDVLAQASETAHALDTWVDAFVRAGTLPAELRGCLETKEANGLEQALQAVSRAYLADSEMEGLLAGLDGRFLPPGLMGDPLRSPSVYPTGVNGCSFDPTRIPHPDAVERGAILGRALIEKCATQGHPCPRTVGLILWGFETARTGGETIGQLLYLVGARIRDAAGWLPSFEPIPLAELGRSRVDVHLMMCGFFRDMFPTLVRDIDQLIRRIAELDEPPEHNPLRAHTEALLKELGPELAAARIFGPPPGQYGTGMPDTVESSAWAAPTELGDLFTNAIGHVYGVKAHGDPAPAAFKTLLTRTEVVAQVIDGEDYKLGDLDHYYEFLGGATRAVQIARGSAPRCLVGDSARATPRIEEASDELRRCTTTRLLNPKWIDAMLAHQRHGGRQIEERVTNLLGLGGTIGVPSLLFDQVFERFVADRELFERLSSNNPQAAAGVTQRLGEANRRKFWRATDEQLELLKERFRSVEMELESD